jgi:ribosomal protein S12 methylthiotransferase accessory factor
MAPLQITRLANVTGLDTIGIPVVLAVRPNARSLAVSQGKGVDLDAAKASALMESIELHHAEHLALPLQLGGLRELERRHRVVDTDRLPKIGLIGFHPERRILWAEARELCSGERLLVPHEMVHCDFRVPFPTGTGCFVMTSNGLASGNNTPEAVLHGMCEVIERDATTLWVFASPEEAARRRVDLESIDDPDCRAMLERYARAGILVGVWETTTDVGVSSFACMIADRERDGIRLLYPTHGMGCHPEPAIALLRALTEAAQARLTFIAGSRDDNGPDKYRAAQNDRTWSEAYERLRQTGTRPFASAARVATESIEGDVSAVLACLQRRGFGEVACVDLSDPRWGLSVVRIIIPGLEPLYEVPGYRPGKRARAVLDTRFGADVA